MKLKNDNYRKTRGGSTQVLKLSCRKCEQRLCYYQKDGPGNLRRLYLDRMTDYSPSGVNNLICVNCEVLLGIRTVYKKENRPCYRLFVDALHKQRVALKDIA